MLMKRLFVTSFALSIVLSACTKRSEHAEVQSEDRASGVIPAVDFFKGDIEFVEKKNSDTFVNLARSNIEKIDLASYKYIDGNKVNTLIVRMANEEEFKAGLPAIDIKGASIDSSMPDRSGNKVASITTVKYKITLTGEVFTQNQVTINAETYEALISEDKPGSKREARIFTLFRIMCGDDHTARLITDKVMSGK